MRLGLWRSVKFLRLKKFLFIPSIFQVIVESFKNASVFTENASVFTELSGAASLNESEEEFVLGKRH